MNPRPELLLHPNVPKPLHGLNPRTLMGEEWWNVQRQAAYAKHDYCCWACGVHKSKATYHQWLEGHETYDYDYENAKAIMKEVVALCYSCHNYIHSGRLLHLYQQENISYAEFVDILSHGQQVLREHDLEMNPFAVLVWNEVCEFKLTSKLTLPTVGRRAWGDWRLVIDGKEYKPLFDSEHDWQKYYSKKTS